MNIVTTANPSLSSATPNGISAQTQMRWMFGPYTDMFFGCGGLYAFLLLCIYGLPAGLKAYVPLGLLPIAVLVTSVPHYGATLLRVYARKEDREKYRSLSVWASLAILGWFVLGVYDVLLGSYLVTLYLTWSPWHYTGQNYGLAVMFLGRRGIVIAPSTKRLLYLSFILSYAMAFLGIHGATGSQIYDDTSTYTLIRLGVPDFSYKLLLVVLGVAYVYMTAVSLSRISRGNKLVDLMPVLGLIALQSSWFCIPLVANAGLIDGWNPNGQLLVYSTLWMAIVHAIQYLWVTNYFARKASPNQPHYEQWGRSLLAGGAIWGIPAFAFAPDLLGVHSYDVGLALLVASAVNVHHFVLDGAIWKLRDGRIARILLRNVGEQAGSALESSIPSGFSRVVFALVAIAGLAYVVIETVATVETKFAIPKYSSPPDYTRLHTAANRLRWIGRDNPELRFKLGIGALRTNQYGNAKRELERSLALGLNHAKAWVALGMVAERQQQWQEAIHAYDEALNLNAQSIPALTASAKIFQRTGELDRAIQRVSRALQIYPKDKRLRSWLEKLNNS